MLDLDAIKKLCDAATPGTWERYGFIGHSGLSRVRAVVGHDCANRDVCVDIPANPEDAKFIAASRELLPQLVAEVERLRAENEKLRNNTNYSDFRAPNTTRPTTRADFAALIVSAMLPGFKWEMLPNGDRGWRWDGYLRDAEMKELYQWIGKEPTHEQLEQMEAERKAKFGAALQAQPLQSA